MKRKTTKEILAESFAEVAAQKKADRITVNDIVRNCGLSPATFYRHFHDKYDMIAWIYRQAFSEIFHRFDGLPNRKELTCAAWVDYCVENKGLLANLFENTRGYDSFIRNMVEQHVGLIENEIIFLRGREVMTEKLHLKVYLYSCGMVRLMCAWLMGKISATKDEMADVILETIPPLVVPLITPPEPK